MTFLAGVVVGIGLCFVTAFILAMGLILLIIRELGRGGNGTAS